MSSPPLTSRQRLVKSSLVWILGSAILLGSAAATLAAPPIPVTGKVYCYCGCIADNSRLGDLAWVKKGACRLAVGRKCSIKDSQGKTHKGKLDDCSECDGVDGAYRNCRAGGGKAGGGGIRAPLGPAQKAP